MSEEKKNEVTEEVKEARKLSEEELEQVNGGTKNPAILYGTQIAILAGATCQAELLEKYSQCN